MNLLSISDDCSYQDPHLGKPTTNDSRIFSRKRHVSGSCSLSMRYCRFGSDDDQYILHIPVHYSRICSQFSGEPIEISWESLIKDGAYLHRLGSSALDITHVKTYNFGLRWVVERVVDMAHGQAHTVVDILLHIHDYSPIRLALHRHSDDSRDRDPSLTIAIESAHLERIPSAISQHLFTLRCLQSKTQQGTICHPLAWMDDALVYTFRRPAPSVRLLMRTENNV